ncbi:MAG: hypothetical protein ACLQKA_11035 [Bryobacteraceae bacterium]
MSDSPSTEQFNTWSEIAGYLGISVREAQYREKNDGLPIRRGVGAKPRVWALRSELDAWRLNAVAGATALAPAPNPAPDPAPTNGASAQSVEESNSSTVQWGRRAILAAAGLAATAVGAKLIFGTRRPRVERAVLTGSLLTALDGLGNPIWTHRFADNLRETANADLAWRVQVIDLEGNGRPGVLAVCTYVPQAAAPQVTMDELSYFAPDGRVKWILPCRPNLLDFEGRQFEPAWWCSCLIALPSAKQKTLWAGINHGWRWPGCVLHVDANGAASVQFANAGHVDTLCRVTRPDGEFVAIAGENNAFDRSFAAVLGASDSASCSPAGGAARCHFANAPAGTPRDYMLFPTTEMIAAEDAPYGYARRVYQTNDGGFLVWASAAESSDAYLIYEFSAATEPKSVMPSGSCPAVHRRLEAEGKLHHTWAACPEIGAPLTIRHYRRGNGWEDQKVPWRAATDRG